jgi:hypothetical protein
MPKKVTKSKKTNTKPKTKPKTKVKDPYSLTIIGEKEVPYVQLEIDMTEQMEQFLVDHAYKNIFNDREALINWAFIDALTKGIALAQSKSK